MSRPRKITIPRASKQDRYYWSLWAQASRVLAGSGMDRADLERERKDMHARIGADPSHRYWRHADLSAWVAACRAITHAADIDPQIRHQAVMSMSHEDRLRQRIRYHSKGPEWLREVIRRVIARPAEKALNMSGACAEQRLDDLNFSELRKVANVVC